MSGRPCFYVNHVVVVVVGRSMSARRRRGCTVDADCVRVARCLRRLPPAADPPVPRYAPVCRCTRVPPPAADPTTTAADDSALTSYGLGAGPRGLCVQARVLGQPCHLDVECSPGTVLSCLCGFCIRTVGGSAFEARALSLSHARTPAPVCVCDLRGGQNERRRGQEEAEAAARAPGMLGNGTPACAAGVPTLLFAGAIVTSEIAVIGSELKEISDRGAGELRAVCVFLQGRGVSKVCACQPHTQDAWNRPHIPHRIGLVCALRSVSWQAWECAAQPESAVPKQTMHEPACIIQLSFVLCGNLYWQ